MPRVPSDVGLANSPKRNQWFAACQQIRVAVARWGAGVLPGVPNALRSMTNLVLVQSGMSPYVSALDAVGRARGVPVGSGPMVLGRVQSIIIEVDALAQQAAADAAALALPGLAPAGAGLSPGVPGQSGMLPGAGFQVGFGVGPAINAVGLAGGGNAGGPLGGVGAGGGGYIQTEDGQGGYIAIPGAGGEFGQQALQSLVAERAREIQSDVDDVPEYGVITVNGTVPTVGKLSGCRKIRQASGYLDAVLVIGTAGTRCTLWVNASVNDNDDWDDTDAATDAEVTSGKPYALIIPEDGFLVVRIGVEGSITCALECKSTSQRADTSRFKSRRHALETGGGHFSALGR